MKGTFMTLFLGTFLLFLSPSLTKAQNPQQPEPPSTEEMAAAEADRLGELLDLEDWQIFYVDSTLQHDYKGLKNELEELMKYRVSNTQVYQKVQDKWMEQVDNTYKKIFNEPQWKRYLKTGAGKMIKAREKRKIKWAKKEAEKKDK